MIISGTGQDKLHTGALVNYTGVGIYHAVPQVTARMLTDAFDEMTSNKTYRYVEHPFPTVAEEVQTK
jgi:hypothetical protein